LENHIETPSWQPDVICFFSAKETRWSSEGLVTLRGIAPKVEEAVLALVRSVDSDLSRDWYSCSGDALISRAATLIREAGMRRDQILLVLDNTETLARSSSDELELGKFISQITKRLGRVIVTSRRREKLEAMPLEVPKLSIADSIRLVERLADELGAESIKKAGAAGRRKAAEKLSGSPILIDSFVRSVARHGHGLERALKLVLTREDLGEFLYEDAWVRISLDQRLSIVALGQLGDSIAGDLVSFVAGNIGCSSNEVLDALEETRFGVRFDYATGFDISLEPSARSFLAEKFGALSTTDRSKVDSAISTSKARAMALAEVLDGTTTDRVAEAFRTDAARAAKLAISRNQLEDGIRWYEEAITVDPQNSALLDRFAFILANKARNFERGWMLAGRACQIDPSNGDAFFTAGHIAASLGNVGAADEKLAQAERLGFLVHRINLQRARARCVSLEKDEALRSVHVSMYELAGELLEKSRITRPHGSEDRKHNAEVEVAESKLSNIRRRLKI
jgi:tetratricopeptide (TPR) repeat protein